MGHRCEENSTATSNVSRHHQLVRLRENERETEKETETKIRQLYKLSFPKNPDYNSITEDYPASSNIFQYTERSPEQIRTEGNVKTYTVLRLSKCCLVEKFKSLKCVTQQISFGTEAHS